MTSAVSFDEGVGPKAGRVTGHKGKVMVELWFPMGEHAYHHYVTGISRSDARQIALGLLDCLDEDVAESPGRLRRAFVYVRRWIRLRTTKMLAPLPRDRN